MVMATVILKKIKIIRSQPLSNLETGSERFLTESRSLAKAFIFLQTILIICPFYNNKLYFFVFI